MQFNHPVRHDLRYAESDFQPQGGELNQPRASPWVERTMRFQAPQGRANFHELSEESRPFRALFEWRSLTQGVALGWLSAPLWGEESEMSASGKSETHSG